MLFKANKEAPTYFICRLLVTEITKKAREHIEAKVSTYTFENASD